MKKLITILALLLCTMSTFAQVPDKMSYQTVVRDNTGALIVNTDITVQISVLQGTRSGAAVFEEVHGTRTNDNGLASFEIGTGITNQGAFTSIDWANGPYFIKTATDPKGGTDYNIEGVSELLSVPYALNARMAENVFSGYYNDLLGKPINISEFANDAGYMIDPNIGGNKGPGSGVPSQVWSLFGNSNSNAANDKLGTTDYTDLVMVTDNLDRLRIGANGDISIARSLEVGENLRVNRSVDLNIQGGETTNHGNLTVSNASATLLTGTLTVDLETDLNSSLDVNNASPTNLTGTLNVDLETDLNSSLDVNNASPTNLTGTLNVDLETDLNSSLDVNNASATNLTGTLNVDLETDLNSSLDVNNASATNLTGTLNVDLETDLNSSLDVNNASATNLTGTLNVDLETDLNSSLDVNNASATNLTGTLNVDGVATLNNTVNITKDAESSNTTSGALIVTGGVGVGKNVNIGGSVTTAGALNVNNILRVTASETVVPNTQFNSYVANFENTTNANGILIKIPEATPANANNFVTFVNSTNNVVGRIEGETLTELTSNIEYKMQKGALDVALTLANINTVTAIMAAILSDADVLAAATSTTACGGLGACATAPIPSLIVATVANAILINADAIAVVIGRDEAEQQLDFFVNNKAANVGVTYQSGSGDYAEWLPKANPSEKFLPGHIIGMKDGKISLITEGADKLFAISTKPIVLGNMPEEGQEAMYEKVAFMGQVPVHVIGKVQTGDYILPSGFNNGFAKAVAPANMKAEDYANIVGMAWSNSTNDSYNAINVAIGLNAGDISKLVAEQNKEISELKRMNRQTQRILAQLLPGFKEAAGMEVDTHELVHAEPITYPSSGQDQHYTAIPDETNIMYYEIPREQINAGIELAKKLFEETGGDMNTHPFWKRFNSDPSYHDIVLDEFASKMQNAIHTHKGINKSKK